MREVVLRGSGNSMTSITRGAWEAGLAEAPGEIADSLHFMTPDHHRVRYFVVQELVRTGSPLDPEFISSSLQLPLGPLRRILDELERNLFFLVRNDRGEVTWAFPVTAEPTPHRLEFSSGERLWAA